MCLSLISDVLSCALSFVRWISMTQFSPLWSSQAMKYEFTANNWGQNNSCRGRAHDHKHQRRHCKSRLHPKTCSSFFFLQIKDIIHWELVSVFGEFCLLLHCFECLREDVWQKWPESWHNHNIMTTCLAKPISRWHSFERKQHGSWPTPTCLHDLAHRDLTSIPKIKLKMKGAASTLSMKSK